MTANRPRTTDGRAAVESRAVRATRSTRGESSTTGARAATTSAVPSARQKRSVLSQLPSILPRTRGARAAVVGSVLTLALAGGLATQASIAAQDTRPAAPTAQAAPEVKLSAPQFRKVKNVGQKFDFSVLATLSSESVSAGAEASKSAREAASQASALKQAVDALKEEAAPPKTVDDPAAAQAFAASQLGKYGWGAGEMPCLVTLWTRESGWKTTAQNADSGAYGIVQALPGTKMASVAPDWQTNYKTQITWGLKYVSERYGSPCGALGFHYANNWY
ncbi:aggregation-promoting factor C-terminal-like domain-containing protein [Arthrobacter woluwensis]|uniref:Transglycosylase SLT domain-containing protein n=1 Tax=Arthrobacter woluwensis TaxID=156980 RepID=A0A1H4VP01_9MICC|nr:hypothetical protein [Arthrobacter woluwensis]SEC82655.1 hypothetical protein SAMN04489745_3267 [Arthrobacter woluwensis]